MDTGFYGMLTCPILNHTYYPTLIQSFLWGKFHVGSFWFQIVRNPWSKILLSFPLGLLAPRHNFFPPKMYRLTTITSVTFKCLSLIYFFYSLQAGLYVIFLLLLSYSLMYGSTRLDPTLYKGTADSLRAFCEILALVMVVLYICEEINQIRR